ncbi:hypothetical protein [Streptomyces sp. NRRL B-24484]|uniref:hypothetical protein n=1 Tax=Streptomyces sp. NRRL B-24484 TaxID=1463833 RepID=UPI0004C10A0E|nr:hypothetical protein [Streptomyces sp. NRRL B-24484]
MSPEQPRRSIRWGLPAGLLAASWLLPVLLHAVRLDVVLLPVIVLAIASVLRVGGGLLDRLVVAGLLFAGSLMTLGLVASFSPWGLHPVPAAGVLLTAVSLATVLGRRRPSLPLRGRPTDLVILGAGAVMWHYVHRPVAGKSAFERLSEILTAEDRIAHFSIFDTLHRVGGYAFINQSQARPSLSPPTEVAYPQGSHFLWTWIDVFRRSSVELGSPAEAYSRYFTYILLSYVLLCMALVWAARWVGGPRLRGWRAAAVCGSVAAFLVTSTLAWLIPAGFDSEIIGLLFLVLIAALVIRPAMGTAEYALVSVAGLVTVAYCYNPYAGFVGLFLIAGAIVHRRRQRKSRRFLYAVQILGGAIAVIPSAVTVLSHFDVGNQAMAGGAKIPLDRSTIIGLGALVVVAALYARNRRVGAVQMVLAVVLGSGLVIGLFGAWQKLTIGAPSYYFEKMVTAGLCLALISVGSIALLFRPVAGRSARRFGLGSEALMSVTAVVAALSLFGGVQWGAPAAEGQTSGFQKSDLLNWAKGKMSGTIGPGPAVFAERDIHRVQAPVITLYSNNAYANWRTSFFAESLLHDSHVMPAYANLLKVQIGGSLRAEHPEEDTPAKAAEREQSYRDSLENLKKVVADCPSTPTILVGDEAASTRLRRDLAAADVRATVLYAPLG